MKITAIQGIMLRCSCEPISDALSTSTARQALLVKIDTDSGIYGMGEAFTYGAPLPVMRYLVEKQLGPMLIGRDPSQIEDHWNTMYWRTIAHGRRGLTMGAISGIDIALWDLMGKALHMPVCDLLGRVSDRVPSYASGGFYGPGKDLDGLKRELEGYKDRGYRHMKIKIGRTKESAMAPLAYMSDQDWSVTWEEDCRRVEAARAVVGAGKLLVDTNASWDCEMALSRGRELVRMGVDGLEEPIPFEDLEGMKQLTRELPLQIIGCETQQGLRNFQVMAQQQAVDVLQPDAGWAGGISECRKIAAMAREYKKTVSLHCFGSAVLLAASLHLSASMANAGMIESEENPNPLKSELICEPFETDGEMNFMVPRGDGLGIRLDWKNLEKYVIKE